MAYDFHSICSHPQENIESTVNATTLEAIGSIQLDTHPFVDLFISRKSRQFVVAFILNWHNCQCLILKVTMFSKIKIKWSRQRCHML